MSRVLDVRNKIPFPLAEGRRLRALSALTVFLPRQVFDRVSPDMPLDRVLLLSNGNAKIGVTETAQGEVSSIIVAMEPGDEISLGCSAEIAVDGVPEGQSAFEQLD